MLNDPATKQAINHTLHCLLGCSVGEILGMVISTALHWGNFANIALSILLAFFFGYLLTFQSLVRKGHERQEAISAAVTTDTTSIVSMEVVDNAFILFVPGAINATLSSALFWWSLLLSLVAAFIITVPVNRFFISKSAGHIHH